MAYFHQGKCKHQNNNKESTSVGLDYQKLDGVGFQKDFWVWVGFGIVKKVSGLVRVCKIINTYPSLNQVVIDDFIPKKSD